VCQEFGCLDSAIEILTLTLEPMTESMGRGKSTKSTFANISCYVSRNSQIAESAIKSTSAKNLISAIGKKPWEESEKSGKRY
jgi:hypothetical protein